MHLLNNGTYHKISVVFCFCFCFFWLSENPMWSAFWIKWYPHNPNPNLAPLLITPTQCQETRVWHVPLGTELSSTHLQQKAVYCWWLKYQNTQIVFHPFCQFLMPTTAPKLLNLELHSLAWTVGCAATTSHSTRFWSFRSTHSMGTLCLRGRSPRTGDTAPVVTAPWTMTSSSEAQFPLLEKWGKTGG